MIHQARRLFQNYQLNDCLKICRQIISDHKNHVAAKVLFSMSMIMNSDSTLDRIEAQSYLDTLTELDFSSLDAATVADIGAAFLLIGQVTKAESCLRGCLERDIIIARDKALLLARLGMVLMQQGLFKDALTVCRQSLNIKHNPIVQMNEARLLARLSDTKKALAFLDQLPLPSKESHPSILEGYIDILFLTEKKIQAEELIEQLLKEVEKIDAITTQQDEQYFLKLIKIRSSFSIANEEYEDAETYLRQGLRIKEDDRDLVHSLADLCDLQGRYSETFRLLKKLSGHHKDDPQIYLSLSNSYIQLKKMDLALNALEQAKVSVDKLKISSLDAKILSIQARIDEENDTDSALKNYHKALEIDAECLPARQGLGHLYLLLGKTKEAIKQFNLVSDRSIVAGFSSLVSVREYPKNEAILGQLENIALQPVWTGASGISAQIRLLFSLSSAREVKKEYQSAFKWANKANRKVKQNLKWSNQETYEFTQSLIKTFSANFFEQYKHYGSDSEVPLFVLGMPRSGTTLMEQMLGNHSDFFAAGELGLVASCVNSIKRWAKHIGSGQTYPESIIQFSQKDLSAMANQHLVSLREIANDSVRHIIDKLPHNFQHIGLIHFLFPKAKIIYCRRHPNAIALSNFFTHYQAAHLGMGFAYDLEDLGEHIADHQVLMEHWLSTLGSNVIRAMDYEAVVENPEKEMRALLEWIGSDWQESVLEHTKLKREVKTASVWQVRQPVYHSSKEKWMNYQEELKPFEAALENKKKLWESKNLHVSKESRELDAQFAKVFDHAVEQHHLGHLNQAELGYRQVLGHTPEHFGARYLLAGIAYQTGHFKPALELYKQVAKHYQSLSAFHYNLGLTYFALKDYENSKLELKWCLKLDKSHMEAHEMLKEIDELLGHGSLSTIEINPTVSNPIQLNTTDMS